MKNTALCGQRNILNETIYPTFCKASSEMRKSPLLFLRSCQCFVNISDIYDCTYGFDYNSQEAQELGHILLRRGIISLTVIFVGFCCSALGLFCTYCHTYKGKSAACSNGGEPVTRRTNPACSWLGCQRQGPLRERFFFILLCALAPGLGMIIPCTSDSTSLQGSQPTCISYLFWRRGNSGPESPCRLPKVVPWERESSIPSIERVPVPA